MQAGTGWRTIELERQMNTVATNTCTRTRLLSFWFDRKWWPLCVSFIPASFKVKNQLVGRFSGSQSMRLETQTLFKFAAYFHIPRYQVICWPLRGLFHSERGTEIKKLHGRRLFPTCKTWLNQRSLVCLILCGGIFFESLRNSRFLPGTWLG